MLYLVSAHQRILVQARSQRSFFATSLENPKAKHYERALSFADPQKPILAIPVFEKYPVSIGINGWPYYVEFVPAGTASPYKRTMTLVSAFDYIAEDTIPICGYLAEGRSRVDIAAVLLRGICKAEHWKTKVEATTVLRNNLTRTFTARFRSQNTTARAEASVNFDGQQILGQGTGTAVCLCGLENSFYSTGGTVISCSTWYSSHNILLPKCLSISIPCPFSLLPPPS